MNKKVLVMVVVSATVLQAGLAGAMFYGRRMTELELRNERERAAATARLVAQAKERALETVPKEPSRWHLQEAIDVSGTLQLIQALGDAAGVEFASVKASQSSTAGRQSFQITGIGTPAQVCAFLGDVEQDGRLIIIESGRLLPGAGVTISFELGLATYHAGGGQ